MSKVSRLSLMGLPNMSEAPAVVVVPLGPNGSKGSASIEADDLQFLLKLGLSPTWNLSPNGHVTASAHRAPGGRVTVSRVLLDAGAKQTVRPIDGNPANLTRSNLQLVEGGSAVRRDRDFLTPENLRRKKKKRI